MMMMMINFGLVLKIGKNISLKRIFLKSFVQSEVIQKLSICTDTVQTFRQKSKLKNLDNKKATYEGGFFI
jgi:hypothetical protein